MQISGTIESIHVPHPCALSPDAVATPHRITSRAHTAPTSACEGIVLGFRGVRVGCVLLVFVAVVGQLIVDQQGTVTVGSSARRLSDQIVIRGGCSTPRVGTAVHVACRRVAFCLILRCQKCTSVRTRHSI